MKKSNINYIDNINNMQPYDYKSLLKYVNYLADHKMGYPVSLLTYFGQVDNKALGIKKGTLANVLLNNVGDPFKDSETSLLEVKRHEREIIKILESFFLMKPNTIRGYVTTGGTEGNFAGLWWSKRYLTNMLVDQLTQFDNQIKLNIQLEKELIADLSKIPLNDHESREKQLQKILHAKDAVLDAKNIMKQMLTPTVFFTKDHTHYSIFKIAEILKLNIKTVEGNDDGSMNLQAFQKEILMNLGAYPYSPIIVVANIGTTVTGAVDHVVRIRQILTELKTKPLFTIHMDGALTGFVLPIIKPFGEVENYFDGIGVNSFAFSAHKYPGLSQPCGIILANRQFYEKAFDKSERNIEYVGNILDITITGSRSGLAVLMFYHAMMTLDIHHGTAKLKKMVEENINLAKQIFVKLKELYGEQDVKYLYQFNISFPKPSRTLCQKYQLMITGKRATICVLSNISKKLIDEFIHDLKLEKELGMSIDFNENDYVIKQLDESYTEQALNLFVETFCYSEPITKHLNIHPMDYEPFAREILQKSIADGLSKAMIDKNNKVIAIAIAEDLANPFKAKVNEYPKLKPIIELIDQLSKPFLSNRQFKKNTILHLWIAGVDQNYRGHGLSTRIEMACIRSAAEKGYSYAYAEFTNEISERVTKQFNVRELCNRIVLQDFQDKHGKRPFSGLKEAATSYVATIRPGVSLAEFDKTALLKENA